MNFEAHGKIIYMNPDKIGGDEPREKAVRKLVRAIIEGNGGDGNRLKEDEGLYGNYKIGYVLFQGDRLAEWCPTHGEMKFKENGKKYQDAFRALMGQ